MFDHAVPELLDQWTTDWEAAMSKRSARMRSSVIRELLKFTMLPDVISFAGGMPAPELFPVREFKEACNYVLENHGETALQYGPSEGYPPLKEFLAESMQKYGIPSVADNILMTNGSQQALDLIGRLFINNGDKILTDAPTYLGAIQAWQVYKPEFITAPLDDEGMDPELVAQALKKHRIKFIYVLPNFHNPAGTTLPFERRQRIVELAAQHGAFIVEDDPYGQLRFEGEDIAPLISMHKENVIYLSTFSKTLSPGIRLGWIVAPEKVIARLVQAKQGADLHTSSFAQFVAHDIAERGIIKRHVQRIRAAYRERRDVMLDAMADHFPAGVHWTRPQGGLFLWARMPEHVDAEELLEKAVQEKVAFVPGTAFYPDGKGGRCCMRLNFSNARPEMIQEGIKRLTQAMLRTFG
ncbi:MAG: PLP-dependent aminotransferase family protein [Chloroflexota bacterium]